MKNLEEINEFLPRYNDQGLIPCITKSITSGEVLMMAWMNEDALYKTMQSNQMHYYSRSRKEIWHKGATSGHIQHLKEMKVDCDQDCLLAFVSVEGSPEIACHTGRHSCFYRNLELSEDTKEIFLKKT